MKKVTAVIAMLICTMALAVSVRAQDITVLYNGVEVDMGGRNIIAEDGRVYVPVDVFSQMGADIGFNEDGIPEIRYECIMADLVSNLVHSSGTITVDEPDDIKVFTENATYAKPRIEDGVIYVPIRTVAEIMGKSVYWDEEESTVAVVDFDVTADEIYRSVSGIVELRKLWTAQLPEKFTRTERLNVAGYDMLKLDNTVSGDGENYRVVMDIEVTTPREAESMSAVVELVITPDSVYIKDYAQLEKLFFDDYSEFTEAAVPDGQWGRVPLSYIADEGELADSEDEILAFVNGGISIEMVKHYIGSFVENIRGRFYSQDAGWGALSREIPGNVQDVIQFLNECFTVTTDENGGGTIKFLILKGETQHEEYFTYEVTYTNGRITASTIDSELTDNAIMPEAHTVMEYTAEKIIVPDDAVDLMAGSEENLVGIAFIGDEVMEDTDGAVMDFRSIVSSLARSNASEVPTAYVNADDPFNYSDCAEYLPIVFVGMGDAETLMERQSMFIGNHEKYIVIGPTTGSAEEMRDLEAAMLEAYGDRFINIREYMSTYGLASLEMEITAEDRAAMDEGRIPPGFLQKDGVHLNKDGVRLLSYLTFDRLIELGYLD